MAFGNAFPYIKEENHAKGVFKISISAQGNVLFSDGCPKIAPFKVWT